LVEPPLRGAARVSTDEPGSALGEVHSREFVANEFGCHGGNQSPALKWSGAPAVRRASRNDVRSLQAAASGWWHWIVYDLPASTNGLRARPAQPACHQEPGTARLMGMRRSPTITVHARPRRSTSSLRDHGLRSECRSFGRPAHRNRGRCGLHHRRKDDWQGEYPRLYQRSSAGGK